MITKNLKFVVVALGILLSFALPASASAQPHIVGDDERQQCTAPCSVTGKFDTEGATFQVDWYVDAQYIKTSTCSDVNSPECQLSTTFSEVGPHSIQVKYQQFGQDTGRVLRVDVIKEEDLPENLEFDLPDKITTPYTFTVCSRRELMSFYWRSSQKFEGSNLEGYAPVESKYSTSQHCWLHTAKLTAPEGNLRIAVDLWNKNDSSDPQGYQSASDTYDRRTTVVDTTQGSFSDFAAVTECTPKATKWRFKSRAYYLALVATTWQLRQQAWVKQSGSWRLVRSRTRHGSTSPDREMYAVKDYGKASLVLRGKKFRKFDKAVQKGKAKVIRKVLIRDKSTDRVLKRAKSKVVPGDSGC